MFDASNWLFTQSTRMNLPIPIKQDCCFPSYHLSNKNCFDKSFNLHLRRKCEKNL